MCSISGVWNLNGHPISRENIQRFSTTMKHRGPNGFGMHVDGSACLALANHRLAIVDPSNRGRQPMVYGENRYWITFNGELYNYIELRSELSNRGYRFSTNTDTEVALAAYISWGPSCQQKFNGMWAFAIWDSEKRILFLSRDRFGVKPLFYTYDGRRFAFASELKAFVALEGFNPAPNFAYLATSIASRRYLHSVPQTLLQDVTRLAAGHCITLTERRTFSLIRWWKTLDHVVAAPKRFEDQVGMFKDLFLDACRIRLRTNTSAGVSLSGGVDSTSVLATSYHIANTDPEVATSDPLEAPRAYVATYKDAVRDESPTARLLIEQLGVEARYERVNPVLASEDLDRMLFHGEDIHSIHPANWTVYQAMDRDNVRVALTGDGSDELFVAYPPHLQAALAESTLFPPNPLRYLRLHRLMTALQAEDYALHSAGWHDTPLGRWESLIAPGKIRRMVLAPNSADIAVAGAELLMVDGLPADESTFADDTRELSRSRLLTRRLYFDFHHGILPWILHLKDMISMAHGVEIRSPFMDWRLVCFAFSLPSSSLVGDMTTKRILRESMRGVLPEAIRQRRGKVSFVNHEGSAFWQMRKRVLEIVHSKAFLECPLWPGKPMQKLIDRTYRERDNSHTEFLWRCVKAARLLRTFNLSY